MDAHLEGLDVLMRDVARQDREALRVLYDRTSAKIYGVCLRVLQSREEAEETLQEIYVLVWQKAATYDAQKGGVMTWLAAMARNKAIDRLRRLRRQRQDTGLPDADLIADQTPDAAAVMVTNEEDARLRSCIERLESSTRAAIREAFFAGLTYDELARKRNVPLGTMKSRIRRGLLALRECLET